MNKYQWKSIHEHQWISINEYGPFRWALLWPPLGRLWPPRCSLCVLWFRMRFVVFKELDFKELEIHRYSLMDTINEHQWISINEFIDGPSMNMVPFLWAPFFGPFFGLHGPGSLGRAL